MVRSSKRRRRPYTYANGPVGGPLTKFRVYPAAQCPAKQDLIYDGQCQGVRGHTGLHWFYRADGCLIQWPYRKDIESDSDMALSMTPPDHKSYIHPQRKIKEHYHSFDRREKIGTMKAEPLDAKTARLLQRFDRKRNRRAKRARSTE